MSLSSDDSASDIFGDVDDKTATKVRRLFYVLGIWNVAVCSTLIGLLKPNGNRSIVPLIIYTLVTYLGYYFSSNICYMSESDENKDEYKPIGVRKYNALEINYLQVCYIRAHQNLLEGTKCFDKLHFLS